MLPQILFHRFENDLEGCRIDHLDGLGHFLVFGRQGIIFEGGGNQPLLVRRRLSNWRIQMKVYSVKDVIT